MAIPNFGTLVRRTVRGTKSEPDRADDSIPDAVARCRLEARLSGKDSAVWISPTATRNGPKPSRSAVTPRADTAGSLEISTAATHPAGITRQPQSRAIAGRSRCRLSLIARNAQLRERAVRVRPAGEAGYG